MKQSLFSHITKWMAASAAALIASSGMAANIIHEFYVPMPETQVRSALVSIEPASGIVGTTMESVVSIVVTGAGTVVHYDQWEDGYEVDINNPSQSSTQIWGDGNNANGVPPGYANDPASFNSGAVINLRNQVPLPRNPANLLYDGRDRLGGTKALVVTRTAWAVAPGTVLAGSVEVTATMDYGTEYISPVGQDVSANQMFEYVGLMVMARENGTSVTVDLNGPVAGGATTFVLNQGESYLVNGAVLKGATVNASKPVQVQLITGDIGARYETDWFTLYPVDQWTGTYYTPVGTAADGDATLGFFYNPTASPLTVNVMTGTGTGSFSVPANGVYQYQMPQNYGAKFTSVGEVPFFGLVTVGANPSANNVHDWGFTLVPSDSLTTEAVVGWGPGSSDLTQNGSPVWVTPISAVRIYVDYNGDRDGPLTDPKGNKYDVHYDLAALETRRIFDPDKDQSAMRVYTLDGVPIAAAWGQDPYTAGPGNPFLDVGTTVLPFPVPTLNKSFSMITDNAPTGLSVNDVIEYRIDVDNKGLLPLGNLLVLDPLNASLTYVANSTSRDGDPIPDGTSGTAFPLDESGYVIPIILRGGNTTFTYRCTINAPGSIANTASNANYNLVSTANVSVPPPAGSTPCGAQFTNSAGVVQSAYAAGGFVYGTLTDPDANNNSSVAESITVAVLNTSNGDSEFITLVETGVNTGIFRNTTGLPTSTTAGTGQMDGTLLVSPGNNLSFTYTDPEFSETCTGNAVIAVPTQNKYLYLSDPSQALDRVDPVAAGDGTTASTGAMSYTPPSVTVGSTTSSSRVGVNSLTFSHTPGTGSNRLLLVTVSIGSDAIAGTAGTVSGVTYGGVAMTQVGTQVAGGATPGARVYIYRLLNPAAGPANVVVSASNNSTITAGATTFENVNQTTPLGTFASSSGSTGNPSLNVTSAVNEIAVSVASNDEANTDQGLTNSGSGQTQLWNISGSNYVSGLASRKSGAASVSFSYTSTDNTQEWAIAGISVKPVASGGGSTTATFVQTPNFASGFTLPAGSTPTVTTYYTVSSGTMPGSPSIAAVLKKGGTTIATSSAATASGGLLTFTFPALGATTSFAAGEALTLEVTTTQTGVTFTIDYDSTTAPSKVTLPTTTVIGVDSLGVYDAPYPGGSLITGPASGTTVYIRSTASDPFGAYDITSMGLSIDGPGTGGDITTTLGAGHVVNTGTATKTYEYVWTVGATEGTYDIVVTANEGSEGINATRATSVNVTFLDLGTPSVTEFTTGLNGPGTSIYAGNEDVCVRITDLDQNTNASVAETITAVITAASGDSELVTLTETGINTGIFVYCIPASTTGGTPHNDGLMHAELGELLTVNYVDPNDPTDTGVDTATIPNVVPAISVTKTLLSPADGQAVVGGALQYSVQVANTGNTTLSTIALTDTFPAANLSFVSASVAPNSSGSGSLAWTNVGPLSPGQSTTITLNFIALASAAPATNTAVANAGGGVTDGDTADVIITNPEVSISKTLLSPNPGPADINDDVVFRITLQNTGDTAIATLPLEDTYSGAEFDFVSATQAPDASGSGSLLWLDVTGAGNLAVGNSITIDITLRAKGAASPAYNLAAANYTVDVNGDPAPPVNSTASITLVAAKITGHVYDDVDQSVNFNVGDGVMQDVTVSLYTDPNGDGNPADGTLVAITTTDTDGYYEFLNLALGDYVIVESQPPGYSSSGDAEGANDNRIKAAVSTFATHSNKDFFDYLTPPVSYASIAGKVWNDANASATVNGGELGIENVQINLVEDTNGNGIADSGEPVVASTLTAADGTYSFGGLSAGNHVVVESDLFNWYSTADVASPNNNMIPVVLTAGANVTGRDFLDVLTGTVGGKVFHDVNGNGLFDLGTDGVLAGVDVIVTDSLGAVQTVVTDANGNWTASVPPGSTNINVDQADPQFTAVFSTGYTQTAGADPTTVTAVSGAGTPGGDDGFRQVGTVTGHLYVDTNGNGTQDGTEPDLAGVDVLITDVDGGAQTVVTDINGDWMATVPPGSVTADVQESDPQFPAGANQTEGVDPSTVTAVANNSVNAGNDGYFIPAVVNGHLYEDTDGNGTQGPGEPDLVDVDVLITDSLGNTQTVTTDANGDWTASVPPGSTTANVDESDTDFTNFILAGYQQTEGNEPTTVTALAGSAVSGGIDGYFNPATVTGHLYIDTNGDGDQDVGEPNLANVDVLITDSNGNTQTVSTDINGDWTASVPPGSTTANVQEGDPQFPTGATQTEGTDPTSVAAVAGTTTPSDNDGYFIPATVTGHLYVDTNGDGDQDVGEPNLANVQVFVTDSNGTIQSVTTNASGNWTASVPPGSTTANVDNADPDFTSVVPAGHQQIEGSDPNTVAAVAGASTSAGNDGYFIPATVTGHLYVDTNGNGTQDVGEPNLANVGVVITNSNGATQTVSTNTSGNWTATVPPGSTTANVDEADPDFVAVVPTGYQQTEGTDPTTVAAVANSSVSAGNDGYYIPATVNGHLYVDTNGDGNQDVGEPNLANVGVLITDSLGNTQTVSTNASGNWTATVPPGSTTANVDNADPDFTGVVPAGYSQTEGTDPTTVTAVANSNVSAGNDGYFIPATVSGHLYIDSNGDGNQDVGEPDLANVNVIITDANGSSQTVPTNASGNWTATVPPGSTTANVDETDPDFPASVTQTEGTDPTTVTAVANSTVSAGNDGYFPPATVTGHLYIDTNGNGSQQVGEPDLANVNVLITDSNGNAQTVSTDGSGNWSASVPPGSTTANVDETDPDFPANVTHTEGTDPTTVTAVASTTVNGGTDGYFPPATVSGHLYIDTNGNGSQEVSEPDLVDVSVLITDSLGNTQTVSTDSNGDWAASVPPGSTTINVQESDADFTNFVLVGYQQTEGNDPTTVTAVAGTNTSGGIDGYYNPATVTGHLYLDVNGDGDQDVGEPNLAGVDVLITDSNGGTQTVTTNASGNWSATVPPGSTVSNIDNADPDFVALVPSGSPQTEGTDPTTTTAVAGTSTFSDDDGFHVPATVTGHLYIDVNGDGDQDGGEPNLANVTVLVTDVNGALHTVVTDASGNWNVSVPPGSTSANVDNADPDFTSLVPAGYQQTEGTDPSAVTAVANSTISAGNDGYYNPATVTGHLYVDTNGNGSQDVGEPDLANIDILITDANGSTQTVTTGPNGDWSASVPPGTTTANVQESDPQFPAGAAQTEGTDPSSVVAVASSSVSAGIDGYYIPATIAGHLYLDVNGNGAQDGSEPDLANVDVLITDSNGNIQTVSTDSNGDWTAPVPPGSATANVDETDPDFVSLVPTGYQQTEGSDPSTVLALANSTVSAGIDGYFIPGTVTGHLYLDTNGNGVQDGSEPDLANVDVLITDSLGGNQTVTTDANGDWSASVPPGSTTANVQETDPQYPAGFAQTEGTDPTIVTAVADATVSAGNDGYYNAATLTGHLYLDTNGNGIQDGTEPDLANVDVLVTDSLGNNQTVSTDANGDWSASVPPGSTTADVVNADPDFPAGAAQTEGTDPSLVTAVAGVSTNAGIDGYFIPATVAGHLYLDTNGNGTQDVGEPSLSDVNILVTDSLGNTQTVATNGSGNWTATVPPGSTSADVDDTDPDFPAGVSQTEGTDPTPVTAVAGSSVSAGNDGYFLPAIVTGHLYVDTNGNGTQQIGEPNLVNVDVVVTDALGNTQTVVTNATGDWTASVPPGSTSANVSELDPDFTALVLTGYQQTEGTDPTVVTAVAGSSVSAGNDGYYNPATITGHLYFDTNGDGNQDSGEPDLAGINILITDSNGNTQTVASNSSGNWTASVPPGSTSANVDETDPDFPAGVVQTEGTDPSSVVAVAAASTSAGIDGWTLVPGTYSITGQVRDDFDSDGNFSDNDTPVSGVTINLWLDVNGDGLLDGGDALLRTTTTNSNGQYSFNGLSDGKYIVEEDDPRPASSTADVAGANDNLIPVTVAGANVTGRDFLDAVDPHGYFYDTETGEIIPGGFITVSGPGTIVISQNGSSGQYAWLANGTGVVYTMSVTPPPGYTLDPSRPALSGPYNPTALPNPNVMGAGENPSAPGTLSNFTAGANPWYQTFVFDAGDGLIINNNIPLLRMKPITFTGWQSRNPLGGSNGPTDDPDGDGYTNLEEFAFCTIPNDGTSAGCPVSVVVQSDGRVDLRVRRVIGISGVQYIPEYIAALASSGANGAGWTDLTGFTPVVTANGDGTETATYQGINTIPAFSNVQGFVRVRVELDTNGDTIPDTTVRSKTAGFTNRTISTKCETFSMPYFGCPPAAGVVDSVAGSMLSAATSIGIGNIASSLASGKEYYIEITSGDHAGHRLELDEANTTATSLAVVAGHPRNTLTTIPATLAGDHWSIRPHHTFSELFPPAKFSGATNSPTTADRISIKSGASFIYYWLYLNGGSPIWVSAVDATLSDAGGTILPPGEGVYVRPKAGVVTLTLAGFVRTNPFARPLAGDSPFVGGGWPMDQSPNQRAMTTVSGFAPNRSSTAADKITLWQGDSVPNAQGYDIYSFSLFSSTTRWITMADATLNSVSDQALLRSTRAGFIKVTAPLPNYLMPLPWTP